MNLSFAPKSTKSFCDVGLFIFMYTHAHLCLCLSLSLFFALSITMAIIIITMTITKMGSLFSKVVLLIKKFLRCFFFCPGLTLFAWNGVKKKRNEDFWWPKHFPIKTRNTRRLKRLPGDKRLEVRGFWGFRGFDNFSSET